MWNHHQGDLADHSEKFLDWGQQVRKADFVITEERDLSKVVQNTYFEASENDHARLLETSINYRQLIDVDHLYL